MHPLAHRGDRVGRGIYTVEIGEFLLMIDGTTIPPLSNSTPSYWLRDPTTGSWPATEPTRLSTKGTRNLCRITTLDKPLRVPEPPAAGEGKPHSDYDE